MVLMAVKRADYPTNYKTSSNSMNPRSLVLQYISVAMLFVPAQLASLKLPTLQSPLARAVVQAVSISATANIVAQLISEYRNEKPIFVDVGKFARFLTISVIMAPMNYCWQALLERTFPAERSGGKNSPAADEDIYNDISPPDHGESVSEAHLLDNNDPAEENVEGANIPEGSTRGGSRSKGRHALRLYIWHTMLKLLVDCFVLGTWWNVILFLILNGALKQESGREVMCSVRVETVPIVLDAFKIWPVAIIVGLTLLPMEKRIVFYSAVNFFWAIYMSLVADRES